MIVDNRVLLSTECEYRLNSDTLFEVITVITEFVSTRSAFCWVLNGVFVTKS
jgi:hypothetical protein